MSSCDFGTTSHILGAGATGGIRTTHTPDHTSTLRLASVTSFPNDNSPIGQQGNTRTAALESTSPQYADTVKQQFYNLVNTGGDNFHTALNMILSGSLGETPIEEIRYLLNATCDTHSHIWSVLCVKNKLGDHTTDLVRQRFDKLLESNAPVSALTMLTDGFFGTKPVAEAQELYAKVVGKQHPLYVFVAQELTKRNMLETSQKEETGSAVASNPRVTPQEDVVVHVAA